MADGLKILIAFDGSELSLEAVKYVALMMPVKQTKIVLFFVESQMPESIWQVEKEMDYSFKGSNLRACLASQRKQFNTAMEKAFAVLKEAGYSDDAIVKKTQAKKLGVVNDLVRESHNDYDAIVLGRRGDSKIKDILLGSVPMRLLKKVQGIPMIIVGGMAHSNRIMVAFDGSKEVMRAVKSMTGLIGVSDAKVTLCHVARPQSKSDQDSQWKEKERLRLEPQITKAKQWVFDAGFSFNQVCCELIDEEQDLSNSIVQKAHKEKYDTIVIGRRGLNIYQEFVSRRVGEKIFQQAEHLTVWVYA